MRWRGCSRWGSRRSSRGRSRSRQSGSGRATPARTCWPHSERNAARRRSPPTGARSPWSAPTCSNRVLGAWLHTRAVRAGGRLVIAIDGKTVRGAKSKGGRAPHLVAALAHGIGAVLGQVAVDEKSNEIPAVRELLKAFADVAGAVFTIDAMHTQTDTAKVILARRADYVMTVKANVPTLYTQLKKLPWAAIPAVSSVGKDHGRQARRTIKARSAGLDRVRRRRPGRAAAPHRHAEREEDRRGRLPDHQRQRRRPGHPGRLGPEPLEDRKLSSLGEGRDLPGRQIAGQDGKRAPGDGLAEEPGHQPLAPGRPGQHSSGQPSPPPRPTAHAKTASGCMNATLPCPGTIPASGKRQKTPAAFIFDYENGKLKESRHYFDMLTFLKQIGAA